MKKPPVKKLRRKRLEGFDYFVIVILTLYALVIFYPFYNAILSSLVSVREYMENPALIWPKHVIWDNYKYIIKESNILRGYGNTLFVVVIGTIYSMFITVSMAYAFSRKGLRGKKFLFLLALFTMIFNGGLVPTYLNIRDLGLMNNLWAIILMYGINTYYMVLIKNSFEQIPEALTEAAMIDGANDLVIFFQIMLPTILPTLVTFGLFIAVDYWNEWYYSMLIINDASLKPLQVILRDIVANASMSMNMGASSITQNVNSDGVKMASIVATMLPIMLVYPFVQKYFVKGITVGAVKM